MTMASLWCSNWAWRLPFLPSVAAYSIPWHFPERNSRSAHHPHHRYSYLQSLWQRPIFAKRFFSTTTSLSAASSPNDVQRPSPNLQATQHLPRLYVETTPSSQKIKNPSLHPGALISISGAQSHYLLDVMRITQAKRWQDLAGHVRIFNGLDGEWLAKVVDVVNTTEEPRRRRPRSSSSKSSTKEDTVLECVEQLLPQSGNDKKQVSIHLYQGRLKKKQHLKWVLEKVTELGVDGITLLELAYTMGGGGDAWDYAKHQSHVIEAAEQCERLTVPTLSVEPLSWKELLEQMHTTQKEKGAVDIWLICRERSESSPPILSALQILYKTHTADVKDPCSLRFHIVVGPEGGWCPEELDAFSNMMVANKEENGAVPQTCLVQFVSLGPLVLRAETAAIAAVAVTSLAVGL